MAAAEAAAGAAAPAGHYRTLQDITEHYRTSQYKQNRKSQLPLLTL